MIVRAAPAPCTRLVRAIRIEAELGIALAILIVDALVFWGMTVVRDNA
jgi:hypothetical protein